MKLGYLIKELSKIYEENGDIECCVFNEYLDNASSSILFKFKEDEDFFTECEELSNGSYLLIG